MYLYHASYVEGITELKPQQYSFGKGVFLAERIQDCCTYLTSPFLTFCKRNSIPIEDAKYYRWNANDRDIHTNTPILLEWWDGAFDECYKGVKGYYYLAEKDNNFRCVNKTRGFYVSEKPVEVVKVIEIPDVLEEYKRLQKEGKIILKTFDKLTNEDKKLIKFYVDGAYRDYKNKPYVKDFLDAKLSWIYNEELDK